MVYKQFFTDKNSMQFFAGLKMQNGNPPASTEFRYQIFLDALAEEGVVTKACERAGIIRRVAYARRQSNPTFAEAWEDAMDAWRDRLRQEAQRRAVNGTYKLLYHQGVPVFEYRTVIGADGLPEKDDNGHDKREVVRDSAGQPVQARTYDFSDALLARMLAANVPEYREKLALTGENGGPIQVEATPLDSARRIAYALHLGMQAKLSHEAHRALPEAIEHLDDGSDLA
jgi:hypothetical protein